MGLPEMLAAGAMRGLLAVQNAVANNLANASTTGYRKNVVSFAAFPQIVAGHRAAGAAPLPTPVTSLDVTPGTLEKTGNPLDLALDGAGYLAVETGRGERYVRSASFRLDGGGHLATADGALLLGDDGRPIHVGSGSVTVSDAGDVYADGARAGRLRIVNVPASELTPEGGVLAAAAGASVTASSAHVRQGYLEHSNVNAIDEMVRMIGTLRQFEFLQQVVRADDEMQQSSAQDVGRLR